MTTDGTDVRCERSLIDAGDGHRIVVDCWSPADATPARGIVQILHGLAEHAARYERFARVCTQCGYVVAAHNHRGHGETCADGGLGHYADDGGWGKVIGDVALVQKNVLARYPDLPLALFGHSMGSYIAQAFVMRHPEAVRALILSATTCAPRLKMKIGHWLAAVEAWRHGGRSVSERLNALSFGDFNRRFAPNRTEFDWLSRDEAEVDRYDSDPLCGAPSSNRLWHDLTGGILEITSSRALRRVPSDLPILITGGEFDPVGGAKGLGLLADRYRGTGHANVTLTVYPEGRHEMLNETNRDQVTADILDWIDAELA